MKILKLILPFLLFTLLTNPTFATVSYGGKESKELTYSARKLGVRTKHQVKGFADWAGDNFTRLVGNESSHIGELIGKYKPAPKNLNAFKEAVRVKKKTRSAGGGLRSRWKDKKGNICEWDSQHGRVEKYNKEGKHLGEFDSNTGVMTKAGDLTRKVEP